MNEQHAPHDEHDGLPTGKQTSDSSGTATIPQTTAETTQEARNAPPNSPKQGAEPSGYKADNPATAGHGPTGLHSTTPENREGKLNPSAPGDAGITPGSDTPDK